jgi:WD40 repeat protein
VDARGDRASTAPSCSTTTLVATLAGHNSWVRGALLVSDERRALSWSDDNTLRLWDLETDATRTFEGHNSSVRGALLLPDGRRALSWSEDSTLRLCDLDSGAARSFEGHDGWALRALLLLGDSRGRVPFFWLAGLRLAGRPEAGGLARHSPDNLLSRVNPAAPSSCFQGRF